MADKEKSTQEAPVKDSKKVVSKSKDSNASTNPSRNIVVEKVTLSMGTGIDQNLLKKGLALLEIVSGKKPIKSLAKKRIPVWSLRPGLPIGCKVTLRGKDAAEKLDILLQAIDKVLAEKAFDAQGNFSFGIKEYLDLPNMEYNYDLGILGFQVSVTLSRPGYRVKERKYFKAKVGKTHVVSKEEAIKFMESTFGVKIQ